MEVIVLAGGLGTRLRSVVHEIPKCLAPISSPHVGEWSIVPQAKIKADACGTTDALTDSRAPKGPVSCSNPSISVPRAPEGAISCSSRPFLEYLLEWLGRYPVEHVVFSVGYLKEQIIGFVKSREWPFSYDFAIEDTPLGTGGGIRLALSKCHGDHVFVVNGDTFYPVDLSAIPFDKPITLALKPMKDFDRYGTVVIDNCHSERSEESVSERPAAEENYFSQGFAKNQFSSAIANPTHRIAQFREKQFCKEGLINGGVYAIDRSRLDLSSLPEKFSFEKEVLEPGAAIGEIGGVVSDAWFIDIGIPEDYRRAQWALPAWAAVQRASVALMASDAQTLFLDRDGVLNKHIPDDYVRNWEMWEWMPGVLEELRKWSGHFRRIVLVSNQRGVGKGVMTDAALSSIHAHMMADILEAGGRLDLALYCTALDKADTRRKPNPGMFYEACSLFPDIDAKSSVMLGDMPSDAAFAANCGMQFILLNPEAAS